MALNLYTKYQSARDVFHEADKALGFPLSRLCFEGPEEELTRTINVQPAVLTASIACLRVAEEVIGGNFPLPDIVAGHSLGEYTALVVAGVLNLSEAVKLVRERGRLMHEAGKLRVGGMIAVLGLDERIVRDICSASDTEVSNINCPGQIVISGAIEHLERFKQLAQEKGARRLIPLKVSGAFHSRWMQPATEGLIAAISESDFNEPIVPVVANVSAEMLLDCEAIREELTDQITNCVKWQKSVENMVNAGVTRFVEIGHAQVLADLIKRINPQVTILNIGDVEIEKQVEQWWSENRRQHIRGLVDEAIRPGKSA